MPLDDNTVRDGDAGFIGFASRLNPVTLQPGMLQDSMNMRLDRGVAQTRKGAKRLADDISTADEPLTLSFSLAADKSVSGITRVGATATATATAHGYSNGDRVNIRGADQSEYNGDFTISNVTANTFDYTVSGSPATPATGTIVANKGPLVRNAYTGGIFAAGVFASQNFENADEYIVLAGPDRAFLWRQGEAIVEKAYPTSSVAETIEDTDTVSVLQAYDRLYILREAPLTATGFDQKLTNGTGITVSGTTATVNVTGHGYSAGHRVRIENSSVAGLNGHEFDIVSAATDTFTITVLSGTVDDGAAGIKVRRVKPPLYWDGDTATNFVRAAAGPAASGPTYKTMRSTGWASYINNRLILPDGRDQVVISDVGDPDTYDPFWQAFKLGVGGDDFIVGVHPWVEGAVLVFCRKSIWLAEINETYTAGGSDSLIAQIGLLTNEIGCSARNTIVTAGQFVFFLSDAGVYRLDTRLDLKLRGDTMPLSEPVADLFETIDQTKVHRAFAIWHNNRYLIALPTTAGGDDTNNLVVAWNALSNAWEYRDTYGIGVDQILVSTYDSERRTFNSRRVGKLWLLEENDDGTDDNVTAGLDGTSVTGRIKSRRFNFGELTSKRIMRSVADVVIPDGGTVTTKINIIDPDRDNQQIGAITNSSGAEENYHLKSPVRFKAHAAELIYETTSKRPQIRSLALEAATKSMPGTLTRNEN